MSTVYNMGSETHTYGPGRSPKAEKHKHVSSTITGPPICWNIKTTIVSALCNFNLKFVF